MKIVADYPPNIEKIKKHFPITENTVFTYGDTLYIPKGTMPDKPLLVHEETHVKQHEAAGGPEAWWDRYFVDREFRLTQELEAYRNQYKAMAGMPLAQKRQYTQSIALDLAGPLYGNIMTVADAIKLITGKPTLPTANKPKSSTQARKDKKKQRQNRKKGRR